ncbi:MAG: M81 family metallopeptidase, partial [Candidatus Latescibacterota bacterium]|nr:M81 family metallopeptidase [Candidatus Latescibacterota bacterium]
RGWQVYPSRYGTAMPSGTVTDDVRETWWDDVQQDLSAALTEGIDGILLILHGAMPFQGFADGEGEILRRIRRVMTDRLGRGPIGLVEPSDNIGGGLLVTALGFWPRSCATKWTTPWS